MGGDVIVIAQARSVLPACPRAGNFTLEIHSFGTEVFPVAVVKKKVVGNSERVSRGLVGKRCSEGGREGAAVDLCPAGCGVRGAGGVIWG